jgi:hypothetical protein
MSGVVGTLRHRTTGKEISGVVRHGLTDNGNMMGVSVGGVHDPSRNQFSTTLWEFTPDAKPLPGDGSVILEPGCYPLYNVSGVWLQANADGGTSRVAPDSVRAVLRQYSVKFFDPDGNTLNPKEYAG